MDVLVAIGYVFSPFVIAFLAHVGWAMGGHAVLLIDSKLLRR
jgi:hypothetical protein